MLTVISKADARAAGLKRYFTGKPCRRGHVCERYLTGHCVECQALCGRIWLEKHPEHRAWQAAYRESHKAIQKVAAKVWYLGHRQLTIQRTRRWRKADPDRYRAWSARHYKENRSRILERARQAYRRTPEKFYARSLRWVERNREKVNAAARRRWLSNPGKYRAAVRNRQLRIAASGTLSPSLVQMLMVSQAGRCACPCHSLLAVTGYHMDHIVPVSKGGANTDSNIQLLTPRCNQRKAAKDNATFMEAQARKYGGRHDHT
jgi:5-methylcytosine-specific restriction endonuclease McrA